MILVVSCQTSSAQLAEENETVQIVFGGDVTWSPGLKKPTYFFGAEDPDSRVTQSGSRRLPYMATEAANALFLDRFGRDLPVEKDWTHYRDAEKYGFGGDPNINPFRYLTPFFSEADIAFVNLETPLSDTARWSGKFRTPTAFAERLQTTGIDIVSTANNHAFDAEGQGLTDTMETLKTAGIQYVGTGDTLSEAIAPVIVEQGNTTFAFLAFSYGVNPTASPIGFATEKVSGVAPLDEFLIKQALMDVQDQADVVILSLHWGLQNTFDIHPDDRALAQRLIEAGADVIVGHHPHLPRGVEKFGDGLIIYSLGNLVFSHGHSYWDDNLLASLEFGNGQLLSAEFKAVSGRGADVFAPEMLSGQRAGEALARLVESSAQMGTVLEMEDGSASVALTRP